MGFFLVWFNALLYISAIIYWHKRSKGVNCGTILLYLYGFTAVMCAIDFARIPFQYKNLTLFPFLYLFLVLLLAFRPFMGSSVGLINRLNVTPYFEKFLRRFVYVYMVLGCTGIYYSLHDVYETLFVKDVIEILNDTYLNDESAVLYHNPVEKFAKNFCQYTTPLAIVSAFFYMSRKYRNYFFSISIILIYVFSSACTGIVNASRGFVAGVVINILVTYILFMPQIEKSIRKKVTVSSLVILGVVVFYYCCPIKIGID